MKIVVIRGTGLIGSKVVQNLTSRGGEAVPASPNTGVNTITGEGLAAVLAGADAVVDPANSPSFEDAAVLEFFQTSGRNLLKAAADARLGHHLALTTVGADRVPDSGYMRAKIAQEQMIEAAARPYTIVRSTRFRIPCAPLLTPPPRAPPCASPPPTYPGPGRGRRVDPEPGSRATLPLAPTESP